MGSSTCQTIVETVLCPEELREAESSWSLDKLEVLGTLGEGRVSSVLFCKSRSHAHSFALKSYFKQLMTIPDCQKVAREIEIHSNQNHPNVLGLYAAFEDLDGIYLVQEYAANGNLYRALEQAGGQFTEKQVTHKIIRPLLSALAELHLQGVIHRDVKPENVLLASDGSVRLADFGLAIDTMLEVPKARVGTLDYFAPEAIGPEVFPGSAKTRSHQPAYGPLVDVWAVGILTYELLLGAPPFESDSCEETLDRIRNEQPFFPSSWSTAAKSFLKSALCKNPALRPSAEQLLEHPWLATSAISDLPPQPSTPKLKEET